jgi:exodeoxyribonuclease-5
MSAEFYVSALTLNVQQKEAYDGILNFLSYNQNEHKFYVLSGWAGTGKTYLLGALHEALDRYGSVFTAPTNKATKVTSRTIGAGAQCKTIYSLLGIRMVANEDRMVLEFPKKPVDLSGYSRIYVDEASMVNESLLAYIRDRSRYSATKWIFIGDRGQLPPVGEKESKVWTLKCPKSHLEKVERYDNEILEFATHVRKCIQRYPDGSLRMRSNHSASEGVWKYNRGGFMRNIERAAKRGLFTEIDNTKAIAWRNKTVNELNQFIRYNIFGKVADKQPWLPGDRVMMGEPVQIGSAIIAHVDDEGTVVEEGVAYHSEYKDFNAYHVTVQIDDGPAVQLNIIHEDSQAKFVRRLGELALMAKKEKHYWREFWALKNAFQSIRHSYALTAHRAQGSTFTNTFLDTADILANSNSYEALRCLYVGATRAQSNLILV